MKRFCLMLIGLLLLTGVVCQAREVTLFDEMDSVVDKALQKFKEAYPEGEPFTYELRQVVVLRPTEYSHPDIRKAYGGWAWVVNFEIAQRIWDYPFLGAFSLSFGIDGEGEVGKADSMKDLLGKSDFSKELFDGTDVVVLDASEVQDW